MKAFYWLFFGLLLASCNEKTQNVEENSSKQSPFEMYKISEMAALMEKMYTNNQAIKQKIEQGNTDLGVFPEEYKTIHVATLTDPSDRDDFFNEQAKKFIAAQELVFSEATRQKENFNNMVDACIACHQKKCGGPIVRIKKLYIK